MNPLLAKPESTWIEIYTRGKGAWQYMRVDIFGEWILFQHTLSRNFKIQSIHLFEARSFKGILFN